MALDRHLEEATERLKEAAVRLEEVRRQGGGPESLQPWLAALTDYCLALAEVQDFNAESIHERLNDLARRQRQIQPAIEP